MNNPVISDKDNHNEVLTEVPDSNAEITSSNLIDHENVNNSKNVDTDNNVDVATMFGTKKKKKPKQFIGGLEANNEVLYDTEKLYNYSDLLTRIQQLITSHNPDLQESKKYIIKPPIVQRAGSRRVAWTNFQLICQIIQRSPDHVCQFILSELGTEGSVTGEGQLILKGRYSTSNIETLLRKYITEYVTCYMCKSPQTILERDSRTRLYTIQCKACGAARSVSIIRSGFHAISRAERKKAKFRA